MTCTGLPNDTIGAGSRLHSTGRQGDSFVPSTSGNEEEDDLYLLAKSVFDLKVRPSLQALFQLKQSSGSSVLTRQSGILNEKKPESCIWQTVLGFA